MKKLYMRFSISYKTKTGKIKYKRYNTQIKNLKEGFLLLNVGEIGYVNWSKGYKISYLICKKIKYFDKPYIKSYRLGKNDIGKDLTYILYKEA